MPPFASRLRISLLLASAVLLGGLAESAAAELKIGVTPGSLADSIAVAAKEAKAIGLDVDVVEFSDWATPNVALASGDLDVNYFQHRAFLDNAVAETGYPLEDVGLGLLPNIGLYSSKISRLSELKDGARVALASDPVNQGRGLQLLEKAGLLRLKDTAGHRPALDDVADNPKHLRFVEVEGPQLVRVLDDVDLAQGYPAHFVNAGKADVARSALLYSGVDDTLFAIRFVTRKDRAEDPDIHRFVALYQSSPSVRAAIHKAFAEDSKLYSLPWLTN